MARGCLLLGGILCAAIAGAFPEVPRASAEALGVTSGMPIETGVVFLNGKLVPPPYVVQRWGTGLRINNIKVSGQLIGWDEFVKTQTGAKVTKTVTPVAAPESAQTVELAPEPSAAADDTESLDDLFDDAPAKKPTRAKVRKPVAPKSQEVVTYSLDGSFVPNDASKELLARVNALRSDVDRTLRLNGFIFFGDGYERISGDARTAERMMALLPDALQHGDTWADFRARVRDSSLSFLPERVCEDLFRNRIDYIKLRERAERMRDTSVF